MESADTDKFLDAFLYPQRSLSLRGFRRFMIVLGLLSALLGGYFLYRGAWPVLGFYGLECLIIYWAIRTNYRDARVYEKVQVTEGELIVERCRHGRPPHRWQFPSFWVRVRLEDHGHDQSRLILSSHGRSLVIGSFLSPDERAEFAGALSAALERARAPSAAPAE